MHKKCQLSSCFIYLSYSCVLQHRSLYPGNIPHFSLYILIISSSHFHDLSFSDSDLEGLEQRSQLLFYVFYFNLRVCFSLRDELVRSIEAFFLSQGYCSCFPQPSKERIQHFRPPSSMPKCKAFHIISLRKGKMNSSTPLSYLLPLPALNRSKARWSSRCPSSSLMHTIFGARDQDSI